MPTRPPLRVLGLNTAKKGRLHRILFQHGVRNGSAIFLPCDQGLEQGRDFFANPKASDPAYVARLQAIDIVVRDLPIGRSCSSPAEPRLVKRRYWKGPRVRRGNATLLQSGRLPRARYAIGPTG